MMDPLVWLTPSLVQSRSQGGEGPVFRRVARALEPSGGSRSAYVVLFAQALDGVQQVSAVRVGLSDL